MAAGRRRLALAAALLAAVTSCASGKKGSSPGFDPIRSLTETSEDQERDLGMQFDREVSKHLKMVDDAVVLGFMNDLGNEILRKVPQQPFVYRFRVVQDPLLNAFAVPGGYIYFHSGTILAAGSVDELAGVMSHEIGHVKGHHYARMREKALIPEILTTLAGIGASVATGQGGAAVAAQGVNQALQLHFSREFENEADQLGMGFMSRAGYDPAGMARFFERIVEIEKKETRSGLAIPPYLYSHPDVKDRIVSVETMAPRLRPQAVPDPGFEPRLREAQARLAILADAGRRSLNPPSPPKSPASDDALAAADRLVREGFANDAIASLEKAEAAAPTDPRLSYRRAELLEQAGRTGAAIAAWRRTLDLDPQQGMVLHRLGLAYKAAGDKRNAIFYLEQSARRFGEKSELQKAAQWEVFKLTYKPFEQSGLADGSDARGADTVAGFSRDQFSTNDEKAVWWGRLNSRYSDHRDEIRVRWKDPSGDVRREEPAEDLSKPVLASVLAIREAHDMRPGSWTVEVLLEEDVVERKSFRIVP
jgi:predicted Zn-dependent protease